MKNEPLTIIHTIASLKHKYGGPPRSVSSLSDAQVRLGSKVYVVTSRSKRAEDEVRTELATVEGVTERLFFPRIAAGFSFYRTLSDIVRLNEETVVHDHGLWLPSNYSTYRFCRRKRIKRVVSPRGMLAHVALSRRRVLKGFVWRFWQRNALLTADAIHVTSDKESHEVRRIGYAGTIVKAFNGVKLPSHSSRSSSREKLVVCLTRLHPIKGVLELVDAVSMANLPSDWKIVIAGPSEDERYAKELKRRVAMYNLQNIIRFDNEIGEEEKWCLLHRAAVYIQTSKTENFGIAIAEAMAAGLPVIATHGTPWSCLKSENLGWWVPFDSELIARALAESVNKGAELRDEMGSRAADYARRNFSWDSAATILRNCYKGL